MLNCYVCKQEKDENLFVLRGDDRPNKYRNICKDCHNQRNRKGYYKRKKQNPFIFKHQRLIISTSQRGIHYDLTPEFLKGIWTGFCPISGEEIVLTTGEGEHLNDNSAELDRFIPELGYVKGNVTWISRKFNRKKNDSTLSELKKLVEWLEVHEPVKEAHGEVIKPPQAPWNKGLKTPNSTERGEGNPNSKLNGKKVREILEEYTGKRGQIAYFATKYKVSRAAISKVVKRETWRHIKI